MSDLIHNRYQVLGVLGEGAMGRVCLVEDVTNGRRAAMKILATPDGPTPGALLQFKQEFRLMTQLRHPHCCEVHEFGLLPDGRPFFVMELVEGHGLDELLPFDSARTREIMAQLLMALDAVHQLGLVHRDLKSQNVRLRPDGVVKLMDFGLMEHAGRSDAPIKGTLAYLAPEAIKRGPVDLRADLYAVGCLAYELLTGRPPFQGDRPIDLLRAHVEDAPPPPSWHVSGVDSRLEEVILRLLAKDPVDRYQGAFQVLDDLGYSVPARLGGSLLTSPLVGRQEELDVLAERLAKLVERQPGGVIALYGNSGIGKSRLLEELRFQAMLESLPIAVGRPYEQGNPPYGLLVQVLHGLLPNFKAHAADALVSTAPALVKLIPEWAEQAGVTVSTVLPELDMAGEKLRLQGAALELLQALARARPFVVMLDDWQWADALSLEVWQALMVQLAEAPVGFVLASRYPPEGEPTWMATVTPRPLGLLDHAGVDRMVAAMLGSQEVAETFLRQVADLSEGSPFFVERLLEHLVQSGTIRIEKGVWHTDVALGPEVVPRTLQPLLLGKVATLGSAAQQVARAAAVRGRELEFALLAEVCRLSDEALFEALDELVARRIFNALEGGAFRFAQDHFHEFLYADLTGTERQRLHGLIARAMAARHPDGLDHAPFELVADVAHHAIAAGDVELTIPFALEAARRHARLYALAPAERLLKTGLSQLAETPAHDPLRVEYLMALGDARRQLGNMHGAKESYTEALPLAERLGLDLVCGRLLGSLGMAHRMLGSWREAFSACERALPLLLAGGALGEAVEARLTTSRSHLFEGNVSLALQEAERAVELAKRADEPRILAEALAHLGHMLITFEPARYQEGMGFLNQTLAILPGLGDKSGLRNAYLLLGSAQSQLGDYPAARICFGRSLSLSEEVGYQAGAVAALVNLGLVGLEQGEFAAATSAAQEAYNRAVRLQHTYLIGVSLVIEGVAAAYRGQYGHGLRLLNQVLGLARDLKNAYLEMLALCWLGEIQVHLHDLDGALAHGNALAALMERTGNTEHLCRRYTQLAELRLRRGELSAAADAAEQAVASATAAHAEGDLVRALEARTRVALAAEQWAVASRAAEKALSIAQRIGSAHRAALLHGLLGEIALATGAIRAEGHFAAQARLAEGLGIEPLLAEAYFGQAAARPYAEEARVFATMARDILERRAAELAPAERERFMTMAERARVMAGNTIEFSLPRAVQRHTGSLIDRIQNLADV